MTIPTKAAAKVSVKKTRNTEVLRKKMTSKAAVSKQTAVKPAATTTVQKPALQPVLKKAATTKMTQPKVASKLATKSATKVATKFVENSVSTKPLKAKKIKLIRDSFTIPKPEYLILDDLKLRAAALQYPIKKSELLRAGIKALAALADAHFLVALKAVPVLKSGRPSK